MKTNSALAATCLALIIVALAGCSAGSKSPTQMVQDLQPTDLNAHAVLAIKQVVINRIAVMPIIADVPFGGEQLAAGAADTITAEVYQQTSGGSWTLVPQNRVMQEVQALPPVTGANLDTTAIQVGEALSADAVLYGKVVRYQERVGADYSAERPASVAFTLKLVDMKTKVILWTARFARTQQPLGANFFNLPNFLQNKGQWLQAGDIAREGVTEAITNLRNSLYTQPNPASPSPSAQ
ncbi:MAG TPA: hypothetical protein VJX23_15730 [Candidatus Binataceae bacterium]|nr:hypothetical protein [Candidatus Binataceae bacterium]